MRLLALPIVAAITVGPFASLRMVGKFGGIFRAGLRPLPEWAPSVHDAASDG